MPDPYPPEYDLADDSDWEGDRLKDICTPFGIEPAASCLRAIDKHSDTGATVSFRLPNGERYYVPDALPRIRELSEEEPVEAWIIHGIAWDGSDWEYAEEVKTASEVEAAMERFADALAEHQALEEEIADVR